MVVTGCTFGIALLKSTFQTVWFCRCFTVKNEQSFYFSSHEYKENLFPFSRMSINFKFSDILHTFLFRFIPSPWLEYARLRHSGRHLMMQIFRWMSLKCNQTLRTAYILQFTRRSITIHFTMASRAVGRITKSVFSQSVLPRVVLSQALSFNTSPRYRIWSCSKETDRSEIGPECLKDMLIDGDVQLFDVREPHELVSLGRIPKSVNIPCECVYKL